MAQPTIDCDKLLVQKLNARYAGKPEAEVREDLAQKFTETWNDAELLTIFEVQNFEGPVVHVIRSSDGKRGTVGFIDTPRVYFAFIEND